MINLLPNALILRKDKSILFSRVVMVSLIHTSFNISILILTALILTLTTFYPKKVFKKKLSFFIFLGIYNITNIKKLFNLANIVLDINNS
jgi:hypothetical protein